MGEIADAIIDGEFDSVTGEYLGEPTGYPRTLERGRPDSIYRSKAPLFSNHNRNKELNGVAKFLSMRGVENDMEADLIIRSYCEQKLNFKGTLSECAVEIQKDFGKFVKYINNN